jgi:hypothetical protein
MQFTITRRNGDVHTVLVDDEDAELVSGHAWRVQGNNSGGVVYAAAMIVRPDGRRKNVYMHHLITGATGIDHVNRNGLDNRRANLRPTTKSQNMANSRPQGGTSEFKGVSWSTSERRWRAQITVNGKTRCIGRFKSERDAADAYDRVAVEAFGEFARTNAMVDAA